MPECTRALRACTAHTGSRWVREIHGRPEAQTAPGISNVGPGIVVVSLITSMASTPEKFVRTEHMESFSHRVVHNGWAGRLRVGLGTQPSARKALAGRLAATNIVGIEWNAHR